MADPTSFKNVSTWWIKETKHFAPNTPTVLVGLKTDLRDDPKLLSALKKKGMLPITSEQGIAKAREIGV